MNLKSCKTYSPEQTEAVGKALSLDMINDPSLPKFVALFGDLGVGKTAFVRGFTSGVAPTARVKSPTFALVNEYRGASISVFHFDMYRISDEDELYSIGFYDYQDRNGVCMVEWSENIEYALPESYIRVEIAKELSQGEDARNISIRLISSKK